MNYRQFGNSDWKVSALGFGCMRFPMTPDGKVDETEAIKMIHYAIDNGVNYLDTAYVYHDGNSEIITGKALKGGYREKVRLATKCPVWLVNKPEDFEKLLDEQLEKLQIDYIDYYLLHALSHDNWNNIILKRDVLKQAEEAKKKGKIKHIGFSFHDTPEAFTEIIDGYDKWDFCQIQYNYLDTNNQAGTSGIKYAASKGIPVVIMEPLRGGKLANPPKDIMEILDSEGLNPPYDCALQWLWDQPEVSVVLSGMSSMKQLEDNIASANKSAIGSMTESQKAALDRVREVYEARAAIPCTRCNYCMPCPNNINIPWNFELYNDGIIHNDVDSSRFSYKRFMDESNRASKCIECRICEEKCPQKIAISEWMPKVHSVLGENNPY